MKSSYYKSNIIQIATISILLIISYWSVIIHDIVLSYDDNLLYLPMGWVLSVGDYLSKIKAGTIIDLQPIRDLSYLLDHVFKKIIPFYSIHIQNILLLIGICFFINRLLKKLTSSTWFSYLLTFIYAFSPIVTSSVAWIAGRKHLLSTFFVLWATDKIFSLRESEDLKLKETFFIGLLFSLSCASHPINALFPVWVFAFFYIRNKINQHKIFLINLALISAITLGSNFYYYKYFYPSLKMIDKIDQNSFMLDFTFLSLGRYFFLMLFPFDALPFSHSMDSFHNGVGLLLIPVIMYFLFKNCSKEKRPLFFLGSIQMLYPLLTVTIFVTNIFCSDTYLLNSFIGFLIVLSTLDISGFKQKFMLISLSLYALGLFIFNLNYIPTYLSDLEIWEYTYRHEPTPVANVYLAIKYLEQNRFKESEFLLNETLKSSPKTYMLQKTLAQNIYKNFNLSTDEKINRLETLAEGPSKYLYLSKLFVLKNEKEKFYDALMNIFKSKKLFVEELISEKERILAYSVFYCSRFQFNHCDQFLLYKTDPAFKNWNQSEYEKSLSFLEKNANKKSNSVNP